MGVRPVTWVYPKTEVRNQSIDGMQGKWILEREIHFGDTGNHPWGLTSANSGYTTDTLLGGDAIFMYIYIYTYVYEDICVCHTCLYLYVCIIMYAHIYIYIYICIITHICLKTYLISYILSCAYIYIYIHYHVYIYIYNYLIIFVKKTHTVRTYIRNNMLFGVCPSTGWYTRPGLGCVKTLMETPWHRSDPRHDRCFISDRRLVGGIPTPLKNMSSSVGIMKFP